MKNNLIMKSVDDDKNQDFFFAILYLKCFTDDNSKFECLKWNCKTFVEWFFFSQSSATGKLLMPSIHFFYFFRWNHFFQFFSLTVAAK